ncbi:MAG: hypothetical protein NC300_05290 [Bacteroidales bacterium]|nr:hypothetical protein [Clostridium sp.]MCM1203538.1 hypothetical protein [Bacteroidales bacterium]
MSEFVINPRLIRGAISDLEEVNASVGKVNTRLAGITNQLVIKEVKGSLQEVVQNVEEDNHNVDTLIKKLDQIVQLYIKAESKIMQDRTDSSNIKEIKGGREQSAGKRTPWYKDLDKTVWKTLLDMSGKAGDFGKGAALPIAILKCVIDGDGITGKDIGMVLKGMGNSAMQIITDDGTADIKKLFGLDKFKSLVTDAEAGWLKRSAKTFTGTIKNELSPFETGTKSLNGGKMAGWTFSLVANGFSNYDEYAGGAISGGRAVAETITETLIDIGKGAAITAGVAAGVAALGISAPAVVVGGAAVAVSAVADVVCKGLTGKGVTEWASDGILDFAVEQGKKLSGAISGVKNAVCGWTKKLAVT